MNSQDGALRVTFFLFAYNQEKCIVDACRAALAQTYSPLEIIFSDDGSSDKTFELMQEIADNYRGPHQVKLNKNHKNLGLIEHVNKSFEISSGDLIVVAAGDDISLPDRVDQLARAYIQSEKKPLVIHSSAIKINEFNKELGVFIPPIISHLPTTCELADCQALYIGATGAWSRQLYTEFGPIQFKNSYEDLVFGFRAVLKDALHYIDSPLIRYRVGGISSAQKIPRLQLFSRIKYRIKKLNIFLDVYEQRLSDLNRIEEWDEYEILKNRLLRNISLQKKRLLIYRNPLLLLFLVFSKDFIGVMRSFNSELKYLAGLFD